MFQVTQDIEERPVPPLFFEPKGKHTRLRWTGANEREIPGLGKLYSRRIQVRNSRLVMGRAKTKNILGPF